MSRTTARIGFWAAVLSGVFGLTYIIAALATVAGWLPKPWDMVYQLPPSLALAWCFMILMACVLDAAPRERRIWAIIGLGFTVVYATINSIVYPTQLTVVIPRLLNGDAQPVALLFMEQGGFMHTINGVAYGLMSLAALFAAQVFTADGAEQHARWAMLAHGVIAPFVVGAIVWPSLVYIGALWIITFPAMAVTLAIVFREARFR